MGRVGTGVSLMSNRLSRNGTQKAWGHRRYAAAALLALALAPWPARAQTTPAPVATRLNTAAEQGPTALLDTLSSELARNPGLAATPAQAAALAQAAAAPTTGYVGAKTPLYRDIAQRIVAAAPAAQKTEIERAVNSVLSSYSDHALRIQPPAAGMPTRTEAADVTQTGYKIGSFTLYPEIQAASYYDDNIYATSHNHVVDWIGTISPHFTLQSDWNRHSLTLDAGADFTGYWSHSSENTADWHASAEGRVDITNRTALLLGAGAQGEHEDRASPDAVEGLTPTRYYAYNTYAGIVHRFDDWTVRGGMALERLAFDNVIGTHGEINNQDRNRDRYTFGTLIRYERNRNFRPFVQAMGDIRRYDHAPDDFGYFRNSDGFLIGVGAYYRLMPNLTGEVMLGVLHRSYTDPRFSAITTPGADATLRWQATPTTSVVLFTERTVDETTLPGSPAYIYTLVGGRVIHDLSDKWSVVLRGAFGHLDFVQAGRTDNEVDSSFGVRYRITSKITLGVDYRYTDRVSGSSLYDFTRNQVYFRIGSQF